MYKVGILTFQNTLNFGAMLQCYGLYQVVAKIGYDVEIINYNCRQIEKQESIISDGTLKSTIKVLLHRGKAKRFSAFLHSMNLSPRCDRENFADITKRYNFIVVGSDQVWNPECTGYDITYFLDQIEDQAKKLSYAASIGLEHFPDCGSDYASLLSGFSSLLVREETAAREIKRFVDMPVQVVIDPTLLAEKNVWESLGRMPTSVTGKHYILVYAISEHERSLQVARKIAEERNLEIVNIQQYGFNRAPGAHNMHDISPEEFVGLFLGADAAVVSSFHGLCFSLIAGVDFFYATDGGTSSSRSSRLLDLMKLLGIEGRSVEDYLGDKAISLDWDSINQRLLHERARSLQLLQTSLDK